MRARNRIILFVIVLIVGGVLWLELPHIAIRRLNSGYAQTRKGMTISEVEMLMAAPLCSTKQPSEPNSAWWDDEKLPESERARIKTSFTFTVRTFFLPVSYEFQFDEAGSLVGRHIYD